MPDANPPEPFNPLDKRNLAETIAMAIGRSEVHQVPPTPFNAAGLYFIYYDGPFPAYAPLVASNKDGCVLPIYIGKGMPRGVRKGGGEAKPGRSGIHPRLVNHANSIGEVANLEIAHFRCRWLSVDEAFIHLSEILLIRKYQPVWNVVVDGFGNNPVGGPRQAGKRSEWDTIHPGRRSRAAEGVDPAREGQLLVAIATHFQSNLADFSSEH